MTRCPRIAQHVVLSGLIAFCVQGTTRAQVLGPAFANDYTIDNLFSVPGVPSPYGGLEFKAGDPDKLLIVGMAEDPLAAIYEIDVTRDAAGHIDGFSGTATVFASAPDADAGLRYGPGGVLFYTTYPSNTIGQIKPGSTSPDKIVALSPLGVASSTGGLSITPAGFPGAGSLKITSYNSDNWYDADLVPDGSGTFDVANAAFRAFLAGVGPESVIYVDTSYPAFTSASVLVCEWYVETVGAYEVDADGDPIPATRRDFLTCCGYWPLGSALDPSTGDFLFADYGSGDQVVVVKTMTGPLGTSYCSPALPNSTGQPGTISAFGSSAVSANDVSLTGASLPAGQFGYFIVGQTQGSFNPVGSQGIICLMGNIGRYNQVANIIQGPTGSIQIDLTSVPVNPPQAVQAGDTWNFQCWYRDNNPGSTSNFTDAVSVVFQ